MVLQGSRIASYFNTPAALILFFVLVFFGNTALGLIRRSWMLNRAELALIYIMWIVATAIPEWGLDQLSADGYHQSNLQRHTREQLG